MTDAAFCFNDTNRERAIVKRSASKKKNGSKSKKCSLPSDKLSRKEIASMNGPVKSWKMTEFYTWDEFKSMPKDIQAEYLNYLIKQYGVGTRTISSVLFEKSASNLGNYIKNSGLEKQIHNVGGSGSIGKRNSGAFKAIIWEARHKMTEPKDTVDESENEPEEQFLSADDMPVRCSMSFSTEYIAKEVDLGEIVEIDKMFKGRKIRVSITIEAVDTQCY